MENAQAHSTATILKCNTADSCMNQCELQQRTERRLTRDRREGQLTDLTQLCSAGKTFFETAKSSVMERLDKDECFHRNLGSLRSGIGRANTVLDLALKRGCKLEILLERIKSRWGGAG